MPSPTLGDPSFIYTSHGTHADLSYTVENLNADVESFTVRVARVQPGAGQANSNANRHASEQPVFEQTLTKPEWGWPSGGAGLVFNGLLTGWEYQVSLTLETTLGTLPILGTRTVVVEAGSLLVPTGPEAPHAWTLHRWVGDGLEEDGSPRVREALSVGWRNVAPEGTGLYTLSVMQNGQSVPLTESPVSGESILILDSASLFRWCDQAAPPPQDIVITDLGGGGSTGIIPPRPDPDLCRDPGTGVAYSYTWATYATDHLGTVRAVYTENPDGSTGTQTFDYEPFGVEIPGGNTGCDNTHRFTGHERDQETGNDYMHFRFYAAGMGRFQKPDNMFDSASGNPQGFNLYSYVSGNPVNLNDPTGHWKGPGHAAMTIISQLAAGRTAGEAAKAAKANVNVDKGATHPVKAGFTNNQAVLTEKHGFSREGETEPKETIERVKADPELQRTQEMKGDSRKMGTVDHSRQDTYAHAGKTLPILDSPVKTLGMILGSKIGLFKWPRFDETTCSNAKGLPEKSQKGRLGGFYGRIILGTPGHIDENTDNMNMNQDAANAAFADTLQGMKDVGYTVTPEAEAMATQAMANVAANNLAVEIVDNKVVVSQPDSRLPQDKVAETQELLDDLSTQGGVSQ